MARQRWTPEQDALILAHPDKMATWEGWKELLPGRSSNSITVRRYLLGVSPARDRAKWTSKQRKALAHYMKLMCSDTGHDPYECMAEMRRLLALAAAKANK